MLGSRRISTLETQIRETRDIAVEARTEGRTHAANCVEHNRRVEDLLAEGRADRERQHAEGQAAVQMVHGRISGLSARINTMIISSLAAMVLALIGAVYAIFAHKLGLS